MKKNSDKIQEFCADIRKEIASLEEMIPNLQDEKDKRCVRFALDALNRAKDEGGSLSLNEYQELAGRTINKGLSSAEVLRHALFEMASEVGEIHGIFQKELQGHPIDRDDLEKEIGDVLWGIAELCTQQGMKLEDVAVRNIEKLKKRYPNGFEEERSVHRGD